jgi:beta-galactosidase
VDDTVRLLQSWAGPLGLGPLERLPDGVECTCRSRGETRYAFVLNHTSTTVTVDCPAAGVDLLSGRAVEGRLELEPFGVAVIKGRRERICDPQTPEPEHV